MRNPGRNTTGLIVFVTVCVLVMTGCVDQVRDDGPADVGSTDTQPSPEDGDQSRRSPPDGDVHADADLHADGDVTPDEGLFLSATLSANPNNTLSAIVTIELREPREVAVAFEGAGTEEQRTGFSVESRSHNIAVVGMRPATTYTLTPVALLEEGEEVRHEPMTFTTGVVPPGGPAIEVIIHQPERMQPGITLLGPINPHTVGEGAPDYIGVDSSGATVWYFQDPNPPSATTGGGHLAREARQLPSGNILLALQREYRIVTPAGDTLRSIPGVTGVNGCNMGLAKIHHDADIMPNGNALLLSAEFCTVDGTPMGDNILLKADTIFEINPEGEDIWEWHALNVLDTTRFPGQLSRRAQQGVGGTTYDWSHANAITYLAEDDTILMSFRHQNWVVKIDRTTKRFRWILGDTGDEQILSSFSLADGGSWFYSQHAPEMNGEGEILIYDNGNERPDDPNAYSRAVIYAIDEESLEATQLWEYRTETFTPFLGDANWLPNGNVLVSAGGVRMDAGGPGSGGPKPGVAQVVEVRTDNPGDEDVKVWELKTEAFVYRANRIGSFWPAKP